MPPATIAIVKRIEAIYFMKDGVLEFIVNDYNDKKGLWGRIIRS